MDDASLQAQNQQVQDDQQVPDFLNAPVDPQALNALAGDPAVVQDVQSMQDDGSDSTEQPVSTGGFSPEVQPVPVQVEQAPTIEAGESLKAPEAAETPEEEIEKPAQKQMDGSGSSSAKAEEKEPEHKKASVYGYPITAKMKAALAQDSSKLNPNTSTAWLKVLTERLQQMYAAKQG